MSKFPYKTSKELREYFIKEGLDKLKEINRSYEPHFIKLDNTIDEITKDIGNRKQQLSHFKETLELHQKGYQAAVQAENEHQICRQSLLENNDSGAERFLQLQTLGSSPMEVYHQTSFGLGEDISRLTREIDRLNNRLTNQNDRKSRAISELKILNSIIDEKSRQLSQEENPNAKPLNAVSHQRLG
ncbi:hypothetical protein EP47_04245 [Legionella norrlandica]|uniref:Uncharacterized protein n=1 Tax=Legionella norrlandica TaxID=1498499 RepID=A0A0A2ST04_9GAMM|nr:hypothetical protein [Legionella norrlandica]KGP64265.1 hypothetical protein EP47_04245 [Legionella norrlandica]